MWVKNIQDQPSDTDNVIYTLSPRDLDLLIISVLLFDILVPSANQTKVTTQCSESFPTTDKQKPDKRKFTKIFT